MVMIRGSMVDWRWKGCCYYAGDDSQPFGFCKKCWIEHGRPEGMKNATE